MVGLERVDFPRGGSEAYKVIGHASEQRGVVGRSGRGKALGLETGKDEAIDGRGAPGRVLDGGDGGMRARLEGPVGRGVRGWWFGRCGERAEGEEG